MTKLEIFYKRLLEDQDSMQALRLLEVSDVEFGKKHWVSQSTILKYMWSIDWKRRRQYPIDEINEIRKTKWDRWVAKDYQMSLCTLVKVCWNRKKLWLPYLREDGTVVLRGQRTPNKSRKSLIVDRKLNTERHPEQVITDYEKAWMKESEPVMKPCKTFYEKLWN